MKTPHVTAAEGDAFKGSSAEITVVAGQSLRWRIEPADNSGLGGLVLTGMTLEVQLLAYGPTRDVILPYAKKGESAGNRAVPYTLVQRNPELDQLEGASGPPSDLPYFVVTTDLARSSDAYSLPSDSGFSNLARCFLSWTMSMRCPDVAVNVKKAAIGIQPRTPNHASVEVRSEWKSNP